MHRDSWYIGRQSVKTHSYLTPSCPPEMGALRFQIWVTVEKGKFFQSLSPSRFQQSVTEETRKFFESRSPKVSALMPMQRRLVWPAAWFTSTWHVADNSLCRNRGCNNWAFYGIPPLPSNECSDSTMKHWQTFFLIPLKPLKHSDCCQYCLPKHEKTDMSFHTVYLHISYNYQNIQQLFP